jgi:hypothetical protein
MQLRRVRKQDVQIQPFHNPDGLAICLECWKTWMLADDRDLSASRMRLHGGAEDEDREGYERDVYAEQRIADYRIGEATGAMIEDLKPAWRWAIYKKCGVSTVWNFPSVDFLSCLADAQSELERKLRVNIATATQFA